MGPEDDDTVDEDATDDDSSVGTPAVIVDSRCKGAVNCIVQSDIREAILSLSSQSGQEEFLHRTSPDHWDGHGKRI